MNTLQATYRVVTPLFISGADQNKADLRPPSFKGVLRFWYRATALPVMKSWIKVQQKEREIFGSTEGQARFMLNIQPVDNISIINAGQKWQGYGSAYLGYGLVRAGKLVTERPYVKQGTRFTVTIALRPKDSAQEQELVDHLKRALIALGLFGGMGSRSRRGFGSLSLESLLYNDREIWAAPVDVNDLKTKLQNFFADLGNSSDYLPEFSAFSARSRVSIVKTAEDALSLLDEVGREMIRYRSYGRQGRTGAHILPWGDEESKQYFSDDHHLVWNVANNTNSTNHPRRVAFGLPHNYRFSNGVIVGLNSEKYERRASPLFIHLHELSEQYAAIITMLPARFLPENDRISLSKRGNRPTNVAQDVDFNVLDGFINRFTGRLEVQL